MKKTHSSQLHRGIFGLLIIVLVLSGLACRAGASRQTPTASPTLEPSATWTPTATLTATPSATPSFTPTASPTDTATPTSSATLTWTLPPTPAVLPTQTVTPTPTPLPLSLQLGVFEDLWSIVNDEYLYPDFNGLDWDAIHDEYRAKIEAGLSNEEFYFALDEMIYRLGDDHSAFLSPEVVAEEDAKYAGNMDYVGIGIMTLAVPERNRATILAVFAGSPAEEAGLQIHDAILSVDGEPILYSDGSLKTILRGPEGTTITVRVQTPGQEPRDIQVTRRRINSPMPIPYTVLTTPNGKRIGYIVLISFGDSTVAERFGDALRDMTADAPLDGLIIDDRPNEGGVDTVLKGVLGYFIKGTAGHFISRNDERALRIPRLEDINGSGELPLVVLVGMGTASYGEVFAGVLKDLDRAYLIGETTGGNVETLWGYDFDDGSRAWIAHESFCPLNHPDENWEESGIIPHLTVLSNWDEVTVETDPAVIAALEYFDK